MAVLSTTSNDAGGDENVGVAGVPTAIMEENVVVVSVLLGAVVEGGAALFTGVELALRSITPVVLVLPVGVTSESSICIIFFLDGWLVN